MKPKRTFVLETNLVISWVSCGVHMLYGLHPIHFGEDYIPSTLLPSLIAPKPQTQGGSSSMVIRKCAFYVFSDADVIGNGIKFAAYIMRHGLGTVTESTQKRNPNSGNAIRVWCWEVDYAAIEAHVKEYNASQHTPDPQAVSPVVETQAVFTEQGTIQLIPLADGVEVRGGSVNVHYNTFVADPPTVQARPMNMTAAEVAQRFGRVTIDRRERFEGMRNGVPRG